MEYIADYPERMNVESVTASFNGASGYLSGNMTLNLYRLDGTGREYVPPVEPEVQLAVEIVANVRDRRQNHAVRVEKRLVLRRFFQAELGHNVGK